MCSIINILNLKISQKILFYSSEDDRIHLRQSFAKSNGNVHEIFGYQFFMIFVHWELTKQHLIFSLVSDRFTFVSNEDCSFI